MFTAYANDKDRQLTQDDEKLSYMKTPEGLIIRPELPGDYAAITHLIHAAYGRSNEGNLVEDLRHNPQFISGFSLVAVLHKLIVGHLLLFPVFVRNAGLVFRSLALSPFSVLPEFQRNGVGAALVVSALDEAKSGKFGSVVAWGSRNYYPALGFVPASHYHIYPPFEVPGHVFFAVELFAGGLKDVSGKIEFPPEFFAF